MACADSSAVLPMIRHKIDEDNLIQVTICHHQTRASIIQLAAISGNVQFLNSLRD
jgi:hypothetical protein